ncbi:acyl-CoA reductase-like NAD-dependent aldehyde dehydrogenase [Paraburkholderia sp. GAS334]
MLVVPYNFPILLFCWQASAALAAGNAVIIKPSEATTLTTLLAMDAFTHLPPGLLQVLGGGAEIGRQLVEHEHTHGIAFTGSVPAGQAVARGAAERFKPVLIEASGNDPCIVMPSAPVAAAARNAAYATFLNAGQVCTSPERFYVHEAVYDDFLAALVKEAQALRVGRGLDDVDMGPMVSQRELQRFERIIGRALEQGARLMTGGRRPQYLHKGWFYEPTVLAVEHHMDIMHDECFGPVAPVCKVSSLDEALRLANDSRFGLGASIYTHDLTEAMRAVNEIESGMVWVNTPLNDNDGVPFGGRKMTGVGRQLGAEGLEQFRRSKMVILAPEVVTGDELFPYQPEHGFRAVVAD